MICECGNKTNNKNGVCNSCRAKINFLNQIREIIEPKKEETKTTIKRIKKRKKYYSQKKHSTICWNCKKACGGCSWSRDFFPVECFGCSFAEAMIYAKKILLNWDKIVEAAKSETSEMVWVDKK